MRKVREKSREAFAQALRRGRVALMASALAIPLMSPGSAIGDRPDYKNATYKECAEASKPLLLNLLAIGLESKTGVKIGVNKVEVEKTPIVGHVKHDITNDAKDGRKYDDVSMDAKFTIKMNKGSADCEMDSKVKMGVALLRKDPLLYPGMDFRKTPSPRPELFIPALAELNQQKDNYGNQDLDKSEYKAAEEKCFDISVGMILSSLFNDELRQMAMRMGNVTYKVVLKDTRKYDSFNLNFEFPVEGYACSIKAGFEKWVGATDSI